MPWHCLIRWGESVKLGPQSSWKTKSTSRGFFLSWLGLAWLGSPALWREGGIISYLMYIPTTWDDAKGSCCAGGL